MSGAAASAPACQSTRGEEAAPGLPWSEDPRAEDKTRVWKLVAERPEGGPLPWLVWGEALKEYWSGTRDRGYVLDFEPLTSRGGTWLWADEGPADREGRSPGAYLGKTLGDLATLAEATPDEVHEAAAALRRAEEDAESGHERGESKAEHEEGREDPARSAGREEHEERHVAGGEAGRETGKGWDEERGRRRSLGVGRGGNSRSIGPLGPAYSRPRPRSARSGSRTARLARMGSRSLISRVIGTSGRLGWGISRLT